MNWTGLGLATVFACALLTTPGPAMAAGFHVFVSGLGNDANPCSLAQPCRTFQRAHDVAPAGGEIDVLDPSGYGSLTVSKAIAIQGHGFATITVAQGAIGLTVNAGVNDRVSLTGLVVDGASVGLTGIMLTSAKSLTIANSIVRNVTASGIALAPTGNAVISISSTTVSDNGANGIFLQPTAGAAHAVFNHVEAYNNGNHGIGVFGNFLAANQGPVEAFAIDTVAAHNAGDGFYVLGQNFVSEFKLFHCSTFGNGHAGVFADAIGEFHVAQSYLDDDWLVANPNVNTGGAVVSWGDNYTVTVPPTGNETKH